MRRLLVTFICFLLCLTTCTYAEESEEEILFRGNNWGAAIDEVISSFPEEIHWNRPKVDSSFSIMDHMLGTHYEYYEGHVCCFVTATSSTLENLEVAGYGVDYIQLRFAYVPTADGFVIEDMANTALYFAEYRIDAIDKDAAFDDLKSKFDDLYGDISIKSYPPNIYTESYNTWYGAEGSMVSLKSKYGSSGRTIHILYGFQGADDLLADALEALAYEECILTESNYDGL